MLSQPQDVIVLPLSNTIKIQLQHSVQISLYIPVPYRNTVNTLCSISTKEYIKEYTNIDRLIFSNYNSWAFLGLYKLVQQLIKAAVAVKQLLVQTGSRGEFHLNILQFIMT